MAFGGDSGSSQRKWHRRDVSTLNELITTAWAGRVVFSELVLGRVAQMVFNTDNTRHHTHQLRLGRIYRQKKSTLGSPSRITNTADANHLQHTQVSPTWQVPPSRHQSANEAQHNMNQLLAYRWKQVSQVETGPESTLASAAVIDTSTPACADPTRQQTNHPNLNQLKQQKRLLPHSTCAHPSLAVPTPQHF